MAKKQAVKGATKVQLNPGGPQVDAVEVPIVESTERWSEYTLEDGSVVKVKQVPLEMLKVVGAYDQEGRPVYVMKAQPIVTVSYVPENLMRKTSS